MRSRLILAVFLAASLAAQQRQPDPKRIKQIQIALIERGYQPGKTWAQTQEILRQIAREHHWQTNHAPDARVLRLLGFSTPAYDFLMPDPATEGRQYLEGKEKP